MINLTKNSRISLEKNGIELKQITVGLDWGAIQRKSFFGLLNDSISVDLDGSVSLFDKNKREIDTVYYHNLVSRDGAIKHSGDDRIGDISSDAKDNEVISINLENISLEVDTIFFYLNSYKQQDFATIPYAKIRIIEGLHHNPKQVFASFNLASDETYRGYVSMIMAKLKRVGNRWEFTALGEPISARTITETIVQIQQEFL
ncbi:MAG: TerD family protein [Spirosomataceae bacterium]